MLTVIKQNLTIYITKSNIKNIDFKAILLLLLLFVTVVFVLQLIFLPITNLSQGLGIDGLWYVGIFYDSNSAISDYHYFKMFPSRFIKFIFEIFLIEINFYNINRAFRLLNYFSIIGSLLVFYKMSFLIKMTLKEFYFLLLASFVNFTLLRVHLNYDVHTPDIFSFFLATLMCYFYLCKNKIGIASVTVIAFFTNPQLQIIGYLLLLLPTQHTFRNSYIIDKTTILFKMISEIPPIVLAIAIGLWGYLVVDYMRTKGLPLTYWDIPDNVNEPLLPLSIVSVALLVWWLSRPLWHGLLRMHLINFVKSISYHWIILMLALFFIKMHIIETNNNPTILDDISHNIKNFAIYFVMKPLCGVFEHFQSLGIVFFLVLMFWKRLIDTIVKHQHFSLIIILGIFLIFLIKPEVRHSLIFVPFIMIYFPKAFAVDLIKLKHLLYLTILMFLYVKFFYPIHWAEFPKGSEASWQSFPAQHYFMFHGFSVNMKNYLILISIDIIVISSLFLVFKKHLNQLQKNHIDLT